MAINFLNTIDLNKNSLNNARIQNLSTDPSVGNSSIGQIYFNTSADTLKQYVADKQNSGNPGWVEIGSDSVEAGTGIGITFSATTGNAVIRNTGIISVLDGTYINLTKQGGGDNTELTADLSAVDGASVLGTRFLSKDNTWDVPAFDQYTHWTLAGDAGTAQDVSSEDTATFTGGININTLVQGTDELVINLDDSITLAGQLTVSGNGQSSVAGQLTIPQLPTADTDAASKHYVDQAVTGALSYQGAYNAATNTPDLDSSPSAAIKTGWTYTVTADGLFFTEQVRVGDVLIANNDAPTTLAEWTTVQNNVDLADLTTVGIGNVNAGTGMSVAYANGTATVTNTQNNSDNTTTGTITAGDLAGTVTHAFGINTIVQTINSSGDTVYCDVTRTTTSCTATIAAVEATDITILVQKIG